MLCMLWLATALTSCIKEDMPPAQCDKEVMLLISVCTEQATPITRSIDEDSIEDVNIFLYDTKGLYPEQHIYADNDVVKCKLKPSIYEVYAVVNIHQDMGNMSREQLQEYCIPYSENYKTLPMAGKATITVQTDIEDPEIVVRRCVAKIVCNISIDNAVSSTMALKSVQMMNVPTSTILFTEGQASTQNTESTPITMTSSQARSCQQTFYLFENCQGKVPHIISQEQKCAEYAPADATYVRVTATDKGKQLTFDVYLGENNTSNFDVRRNTAQTLDISLKGENDVDARLDKFEVTIEDDFQDTNYRVTTHDYCTHSADKNLYLTVTNPEEAGALTATVTLNTGERGALRVGGNPIITTYSFPLNNASGIYNIPIEYAPAAGIYSSSNSRLQYTVRVTNTDGYSYTKTFSHYFYNEIMIYTYWSGQDKTAGRVDDVTQAVRENRHYGDEYYTQILVLESPKLNIISNDGFVFDGWYRDINLSNMASTVYSYNYPVTTFKSVLYTKFHKELVYIYSDLNNTTFYSDNGYTTDSSKQAYIVKPGSRCTISAAADKTFVAWWSNYVNHYPRKKLSTVSDYSFTAKANTTIVPEYSSN